MKPSLSQRRSSLHTVLNRHAPLCHVRVTSISKPRPQPWVTPSLQNILQKRISLHRKVRKHPNDSQLLQSYRSCRREGALHNKRLKTAHCFHLFKTHRRNPKGQWMMLNQLAGRNTVRSIPKASLRHLTSVFANLVCDQSKPDTFQLPCPSQTHPAFDNFSPVTHHA